MDRPGEHAVSVVHDDIALVVRFHHPKEEHVLDVGCRHSTPALAGQPHRSNPDLLSYFLADDGFSLVLVLESIRVGDVGVQPVPEELFYQCNLAIIPLCDVPDISSSLSVTLPGLPGAGKRPLIVPVYNFTILDEHVHGLLVVG